MLSGSHTIVIDAKQKGSQYWHDVWHYRELFIFLTWRDILVRYKQTVIGILWSLLRPILTMLIFTVVFGKFAKLPSEGTAPYALMVFAALLPWQMFSNAITESSNSVIVNAAMVSKVYFPRIILPASAVITALVDFLIAFLVYVLLIIYYGVLPGWQIILMPFFIALALVTALGAGFLISALNVSYRDFRYIIPFIVQLGLYISPVGFSSAIVPEKWRLLYSLNPMVGVIDGFRWMLLGEKFEFYMPGFVASCVASILLFWLGIVTFRRLESSFADKI